MTDAVNILIVDDDEMYRHTFALILTEQGFDAAAAPNGSRGLEMLRRGNYSIVLVDYRMPDMDGLQFLRAAREINPKAEYVLVTAFSNVETAVEAIKLGAFHYIEKPTPAEKLIGLVQKIVEEQRFLDLPADAALHLTFDGMPLTLIGKSPAMRRVFESLLKAAPTDSTVLVLGESGTGKEVAAKAVHAASLRRDKPFVTMDCSTLVETLYESELFGHVKGSFTGAVATKHGAFEAAHSGTFFLDEVGNIPLSAQAKILRALQEKEIRRVGSTQTIRVDVRVVAATNVDLEKAVQEGLFREDLFYRLNVVPIRLPALRERKEDIPLLADYFIRLHRRQRRQTAAEGLSPEALELMLDYEWPGNVRELQNVIERALVIEESPLIRIGSLPPHLRERRALEEEPLSLEAVERQHIRRVLESTNRNIAQTARLLGIDRKTLYKKIRKLGL